MRRVGTSVGFVFADLRLYRSFFNDTVHPMIGSTPFEDFKKRITALGEDENIKHIFVVTSVPLLFITRFLAKIAYLAEKVCCYLLELILFHEAIEFSVD